MKFFAETGVEIRRDNEGIVRQIHHPLQAYTGEGVHTPRRQLEGLFASSSPNLFASSSPRELADEYLKDIAPLLGLSDAGTQDQGSRAHAFGSADEARSLDFIEEKASLDIAAVSYGQTVREIPVWGAGITIRVQLDPLQVLGVQNELRYDIHDEEVEVPEDAAFLPELFDDQKLRDFLARRSQSGQARLNGARLVVYRYRPEDRIESISLPEEAAGHRSPPTLGLPPVPKEIEAGRYYIVTELLFTLVLEGWGGLNWRAFVEPRTGAILYLRAFTAACTGLVFVRDPVTAAGPGLCAESPSPELNVVRDRVRLNGMRGNASDGMRRLEGDLVEVKDTDSPTSSPPAEHHPFEFEYGARTPQFAAVNAYHHVDSIFRFIQELGFELSTYFDGTDFPVSVDHYALFGEANAEARGNILGNGLEEFRFVLVQRGEPVGVASDFRIVWHEFGHAFLYEHVSSPNVGFAHSTGDALAAILSDPRSSAPDRFETFPFITASDPTKSRRHDRDPLLGWSWGGLHDDGQYGSEQMLSTTLFRIYRAIGGDSPVLDERIRAARYMTFLIIKAIGSLKYETPDPQVFVDALIDSDLTTGRFESWPGGLLHKIIRWGFEKQGLYEGAPPAVDVYIDDGRAGDYLPYQAGGSESDQAWNRRSPDQGTAHQTPEVGTANHIYVKVSNRGTGSAENVVVRGFQAAGPGIQVWPVDWHVLHVPETAAPDSIPPGGEVVVGPLQWIPLEEESSILFSVTADGDPSILDTRASESEVPSAYLDAFDNNIVFHRLP